MTAQSPFKFLDSYTEQDREIFFGRDQEIEEVYKKVFQGQTLFIYGESGTGKSSLISCGLANRFKKSDWLPVHVRRGENINESLTREIKKTGLTDISLNGDSRNNLFKLTRSLYLDFFKPIYFIFDQFEELYLLGDKEEWEEFVGGIKALSEKELNVHFIFIIRSEYLHFLSEFEYELPEIFNNKIRVEKITRTKARECIEGPCNVFDIELEKDFTDQLFDKLSPDSIEVELTYLQVYLDRVYKLASSKAEDDKVVFSNSLLEDIGLVSDVLSDFLDEQIEEMPNQESALNTLKAFVTVDGTKKQVNTEEVVSFAQSIGKSLNEVQAQQVINELLERRILKEIPDLKKFELRHDALALKIYEKITIRERELIEVKQFLEYGLAEYQKRKFLLNDKDLAYIEPHLPQLNLRGEIKEFVDESMDQAGRKRRIRKRVIAIVAIIIILLITSVIGFILAQQQREQALLQKEIAEENAYEAEEQKKLAEINASLAVEAQDEAEKNAEEASRQAFIAQENEQLAKEQASIAEQQRSLAQEQRVEAESQREQAIEQRQIAENQRRRAEEQTVIAQEALQQIEKLRILSNAVSLANKSIALRQEPLKSQLALQAYSFYSSQPVEGRNSSILNALHFAMKSQFGPEYNVLQGHTGRINQIHLSNNDFFSLEDAGKLLQWTMADGKFESHEFMKIEETSGISRRVNALSENNEGHFLVSTGSNLFWYIREEVLTPIELKQFKGTVIKILPGDSIWTILSSDQIVTLSINDDNSLNTRYRQFETQIVDAARFNDEYLLLSQEGVSIYDRTRDSVRNTNYTLEPFPTKIAYSAKRNEVAIGNGEGQVILYNPDDQQIIERFPGHTSIISVLQFSDTDNKLISAGFDRVVNIWDLEDFGQEPLQFADHDQFVTAVGYSLVNQLIVVGEIDGTLNYYNLDSDVSYKRLCQSVDEAMNAATWERYVGNEFEYNPYKCEEK